MNHRGIHIVRWEWYWGLKFNQSKLSRVTMLGTDVLFDGLIGSYTARINWSADIYFLKFIKTIWAVSNWFALFLCCSWHFLSTSGSMPSLVVIYSLGYRSLSRHQFFSGMKPNFQIYRFTEFDKNFDIVYAAHLGSCPILSDATQQVVQIAQWCHPVSSCSYLLATSNES